MIESARERAAEIAADEAEAAKKKAAEREAAELKDSVIGSRYTTAAVKLRKSASKDAKSVDIIDEAKKIKVTDTVRKGYRQVVVDGKARWVTDEYLSKKKPSADETAGISDASCSKSSSIESGLVSNGVKAYRAICAAFPQVSSFGGRRSSNDFHGSGQAIDAMISDSKAGWRLANWVRANASRARCQRGHLLPEDLDRAAVRRGLARHVGPRVLDRQPLRPRARLGLLSHSRPRFGGASPDTPL